jgi:hypothetical protein
MRGPTGAVSRRAMAQPAPQPLRRESQRRGRCGRSRLTLLDVGNGQGRRDGGVVSDEVALGAFEQGAFVRRWCRR